MPLFCRWVVVVILIFAGFERASACSCSDRPVCGLQRYGTADFIGEVLSRQLVDEKGKMFLDSYGGRQVQFEVRVIESFRGTQKAGEIVHIQTGQGGGDCGYRFEIGKRYLIDVMDENNLLQTDICMLTVPVEESKVEIDSLRNFAAGIRIPDLVGILKQGSQTADGWHEQPISGIEVVLKPTRTAFFRTFTDSIGRFTFSQIPSGSYRVALGNLPSSLSPRVANFGDVDEQDELPTLTIPSTTEGSAACHVEIYVDSSSNISGIVKAKGRKLPEGWINADLMKDGETENTISSATPASDGFFRLAHLPPGTYQIRFTRRKGVVEGRPQIIQVKDGEHVTGVVLTEK